MRAIACQVVACVILGCVNAAAQPGTADAVQAIIRGEFQRAVDMLEPLSDGPGADPLAQFLLATMYESGTGVRTNSLMACGLYNASARPANPFESQARRLGQRIQGPLTGFVRELCTTDTRIIGPAGSMVRGEGPLRVPDPPIVDRSQESRTSAGVEAFLRGDYASAASLLQIAADAPVTTPARVNAAEFFMAAMYETGAGVTSDPVRACAMYHRAASGTSPFSIPSLELWRISRERLTPAQSDDCVLFGNIGVMPGFQPATFQLERGYSIAIDIRGATIHYAGSDTRIKWDLALRNTRFLPIQYTRLSAGPSRLTKRHFLEVFRWVPRRAGQWQLLWQLSEVIRNELSPVANEQLETISAEQPPTQIDPELRSLVHLGVTGSGDVEVTIVGGDHPRSGIIDSDAERQAARALGDLRRAESRLDPQRRFDINRPPAFAYVAAEGCGRVSAQGWSADRAEALSLHIDANRLALSATPKTVDISRQKAISVVIHVYDRSVKGSPFCAIDAVERLPSQAWTATHGKLTVSIRSPQRRLNGEHRDYATVRIEGAEFVSASGIRMKPKRPIVLSAQIRRPSPSM